MHGRKCSEVICLDRNESLNNYLDDRKLHIPSE